MPINSPINQNLPSSMPPRKDEPEDIFHEIEPASARPAPARPYTKNAPPPPNIDRVSAPAGPSFPATEPEIPIRAPWEQKSAPQSVRPAVSASARPEPSRPVVKKSDEGLLGPALGASSDTLLGAGETRHTPGLPKGLTPKNETSSLPEITEGVERKKPLFKSKVFIIILLLVLVGSGVGFAGWLVYQQLTVERSPEGVIDDNVTGDDSGESAAEPVTEPPTPEVSEAPSPVVDEFIDSDLDGVSDDEERIYGTDINNPDSDFDGLTDRDETKTWQTDPLNPDTDGDSFKDGDEINNRYNPKGPGKLFEQVP